MSFDNFDRSEKRVSRIHGDCEGCCNNKNNHKGLQVHNNL